MPVADPKTYLGDIVSALREQHTKSIINIVCHGHSVPAGFTANPYVDTFSSYPWLLHRSLKERFPFAVLNVIVSAVAGENSGEGVNRFDSDTLSHRPRVILIDYGLNDRWISLEQSRTCWSTMIERALAANAKVLLLTPTIDLRTNKPQLDKLIAMIRELADSNSVGLVDSHAEFGRYAASVGAPEDLMTTWNHPNRLGNELVTRAIMRWFVAWSDS